MLLEKLGNKFDGFGFESNEAINNKILVDMDNFASDIFKKDKNITKEDLKKNQMIFQRIQIIIKKNF